MQEANFESLIKIIFYILVFFYVFKFLARLLLPVVVKKVVQKAEQSFQQQYGGFQQQRQSTQDEIIVNTSKSSKPRETKKVGEYVDYEEIE
ncbi:MAG: DUF4834 family protein [Flavobacterium sp.]|nr:DUF4834 family protein [Flavobacterium sp.]